MVVSSWPVRLRSGRENAPGVAVIAIDLALAVVATMALAAAWVRPASALPALPTLAPAAWPGGPKVASQAAAALATGVVSQGAPPRLFGAVVVNGHERTGQGHVAFTFDDGPSAGTTPRILATLAQHEGPAAFFVCDYQIDGDSAGKRANARALDAVIAAGHLVGNHTYKHTHLGTASVPLAWNAVARNERLIEPHLGGATHLFRPPYGLLSPLADRLLADLGYTIVRWSIDPDDYRPRSPTEVRDRVLRDIFSRGGGVVLLHDTKPWTAKALPMILSGLERENCRRIARGEEPILPVSLDYFATDAAGAAMPVPPEVEAQTQRTRAALDRRCEARRSSDRPAHRPRQPTISPAIPSESQPATRPD